MMTGRMGVFDRVFGRGDPRGQAAAARRAELRGDLAKAAELWSEADRPDEAARVMLVRGDAEPDGRARLTHYTQAAAIAPEGHEVRRLARKKRAQLVVAIAGGGRERDDGTGAIGAIGAVARMDVLEAARELEEIGELAAAAQAYAAAGDVDGEARALAQAGEVDKLEEVLASSHAGERRARRQREAHGEIDLLAATGRRREALALAERFAAEQPDDAYARDRAATLRARRVSSASVRVAVHDAALRLLLGDVVTLGRDAGDGAEPARLVVAAHAVSRAHLRVARADGGAAIVEDLASRNGTWLRGMRIAGPIPVGAGLDLALGGEVPVRVEPCAELPGAIAIVVGGARHVAPLGPARVGAWVLSRAADGWLELASDAAHGAYLGDVLLVARATLLAGDAIADARGAAPILRIEGS